VVISFFYVNCPTAQPSIISLFKLQKELGEKMGEEIVLLTLSVDPERDDLKAIREYAGRYNPRKGWYFVTGSPASMNVINRKLGNTLNLPEGHLRQFLLGNLRTGHWMRLVETAPALALRDGLDSLAEQAR
jgi:protein SCO1/2